MNVDKSFSLFNENTDSSELESLESDIQSILDKDFSSDREWSLDQILENESTQIISQSYSATPDGSENQIEQSQSLFSEQREVFTSSPLPEYDTRNTRYTGTTRTSTGTSNEKRSRNPVKFHLEKNTIHQYTQLTPYDPRKDFIPTQSSISSNRSSISSNKSKYSLSDLNSTRPLNDPTESNSTSGDHFWKHDSIDDHEVFAEIKKPTKKRAPTTTRHKSACTYH